MSVSECEGPDSVAQAGPKESGPSSLASLASQVRLDGSLDWRLMMMLKPGQAWWHLVLSTKNSWLPGDPRGFRSRKHRIHSSGDYKHRPPAGEHEGLRRFHQDHSGQGIVIPMALRERLGQALRKKTEELETVVLMIAVAGQHAHLLVAWVDESGAAKRLAGKLKQSSSHAVRDALPGQLWAEGGKPTRIRNADHYAEVHDYILRHIEKGAWIWSPEMKPASRI